MYLHVYTYIYIHVGLGFRVFLGTQEGLQCDYLGPKYILYSHLLLSPDWWSSRECFFAASFPYAPKEAVLTHLDAKKKVHQSQKPKP